MLAISVALIPRHSSSIPYKDRKFNPEGLLLEYFFSIKV